MEGVSTLQFVLWRLCSVDCCLMFIPIHHSNNQSPSLKYVQYDIDTDIITYYFQDLFEVSSLV